MKKLFVLLSLMLMGSVVTSCGSNNQQPAAAAAVNPYANMSYPANCYNGQCSCPAGMTLSGSSCMSNGSMPGQCYGQTGCIPPTGYPNGGAYYPGYNGYQGYGNYYGYPSYQSGGGQNCQLIQGGAYYFCWVRY